MVGFSFFKPGITLKKLHSQQAQLKILDVDKRRKNSCTNLTKYYIFCTAMFYYRAWTGNLHQQQGGDQYDDPYNDLLYSQFLYHRWGYATLLGLTILCSLILNLGFALAFVGNKAIRCLPHWPLLCLCVRDLCVTLVLIPIAIDWFVVNFGIWRSGEVFCQVAGFFDYTLATCYPLILISMGVILYTRRYYPHQHDGFDLPIEEPDTTMGMGLGPIPNITIQSSTPIPGSSVTNSYSQRAGSKPPSVIGSVDGYRNGRGQRIAGAPGGAPPRPFHIAPNRPGSVTGSIEGRLAAGRMAGRRNNYAPSLDGSRTGSYVHGGTGATSRNNTFRASSPIREEHMSLGDADDLWEAASLDYPGRDFESPRPWDELLQPAEVKYFTWHLILLGLACCLSLAIGIPAALMIEYFPFRRPGCSIPVDPFSNPHSPTITDAGFNFTISFLVIDFIIPAVFLLMLICLICFHRLADKRFKTFVKILAVLSAIFVASRAPLDIIQLKALIEAGMGFRLRDAYAIEHEIVLIWLTYLPLLLNPIVYFSYLSDYRQGTLKIVRKVFGCKPAIPKQEDLLTEKNLQAAQIKEDDEKSKTIETNIL